MSSILRKYDLQSLDRDYKPIYTAYRHTISLEVRELLQSSHLNYKSGKQAYENLIRSYLDKRLPELVSESLPIHQIIADMVIADTLEYGPIDFFRHLSDFEEVRFLGIDRGELLLTGDEYDQARPIMYNFFSMQNFHLVLERIAADAGKRFDQKYPFFCHRWNRDFVVEAVMYPVVSTVWLKLRKAQAWD